MTSRVQDLHPPPVTPTSCFLSVVPQSLDDDAHLHGGGGGALNGGGLRKASYDDDDGLPDRDPGRHHGNPGAGGIARGESFVSAAMYV